MCQTHTQGRGRSQTLRLQCAGCRAVSLCVGCRARQPTSCCFVGGCCCLLQAADPTLITAASNNNLLASKPVWWQSCSRRCCGTARGTEALCAGVLCCRCCCFSGCQAGFTWPPRSSRPGRAHLFCLGRTTTEAVGVTQHSTAQHTAVSTRAIGLLLAVTLPLAGLTRTRPSACQAHTRHRRTPYTLNSAN